MEEPRSEREILAEALDLLAALLDNGRSPKSVSSRLWSLSYELQSIDSDRIAEQVLSKTLERAQTRQVRKALGGNR